MIYSTNRTTSLNENVVIDVNESYYGIGAMSFLEESAQDELAIFESAIKSDIDEVMIGESVEELAALNEGFVENAANKIKEMMKKFMAWLEAVTRSALAKLTQLLVRDNAKFAAAAKKKIVTMKNKGKFVYKGKALKTIANQSSDKINAIKEVENLVDEVMNGSHDVSAVRTKIEGLKEKSEKLSVSEAMKEIVYNEENGDLALVEKHLKFLESLGKDELKKIKTEMDKAKKKANEIVKKANTMLKDAKEEAKEEAQVKVEVASMYRTYVQKVVNFTMGLVKAQAKIARGVVAKAMGATPKNEGAEYDEELTMAMIESAEYEYDSALEEMSEGSDCEDLEDLEDDADEE